jgi:hypothetical protein
LTERAIRHTVFAPDRGERYVSIYALEAYTEVKQVMSHLGQAAA